MAYSDKVIEHYENPRNVGSFAADEDGVATGMVGAPACGDVMKLQIKVNPTTGVIEDARFKTYGCGSAIASSSLVADEARPPELTCDQVMAAAQTGESTLPFFAGYLLSFEHLKDVAEVLGSALSAGGKYFLFCNNIDLSKRYQVPYKGAMFYVLPIDEGTVYNELLELLYLEKNELKKLDTGAKLDAIADAALKYDVTFDTITYAEGLALMGPVRNPNENRPV